MRRYELMVILDPDLEEKTVAPSLETYLKIIKEGGGKVNKLDIWVDVLSITTSFISFPFLEHLTLPSGSSMILNQLVAGSIMVRHMKSKQLSSFPFNM